MFVYGRCDALTFGSFASQDFTRLSEVLKVDEAAEEEPEPAARASKRRRRK